MEHAAPRFKHSLGMDAHCDLIMMWQAAINGWIPPTRITRDQYQSLRHAEPSALRGFAGFGCSFGAKWFDSFHGNDISGTGAITTVCGASQRAVVRQAIVFQKTNTEFRNGLFGSFTPLPGTVVYCDPPYIDTQGYSTGSFDYQYFYDTLKIWVNLGCHVYVSEYRVPSYVKALTIWSGEKRNTLSRISKDLVADEKLFQIFA